MAVWTKLQLGPADAAEYVPNVLQGTSIDIVLTLFDSVTCITTASDSAPSVAVTRPDGGQASITLVATDTPPAGVYSGSSASLGIPGIWNFRVTCTVGGGTFSVLAEGQVQVVADYSSSVSTPTQWIFVSAITPTNPYQILASNPDIAADCRAGSVALIAPVNPADATPFTVKDWFNKSATAPITITTTDGSELENPSNPGTYATTVYIADPDGFAGTWIYSLEQDQWGIST